MLCSCRLSPLRLFLQGVSQTLVSEPAVATRLPQHLKNSQALRLGQRSTFATSAIYKRKGDWQGQEGKGRPRRRGRSRGRREAEKGNLADPKGGPEEEVPRGLEPAQAPLAGRHRGHQGAARAYTLRTLADKFEVSPEAIRRILKSKWQASPEEEEDRQERWFRRGVNVWSRYAELGMKPPSKWRREGVTRDPSYHENRKAAIQRRKEEEAEEDAGERMQRKLSDTIL
ncbi:mitochondrion organization and biogenesis protein [Colletotrichum tofieldiae]|nr:mitochondrion organization and biogenesis protein [Colletotrichum tofieldiae]